MWVWAGWGGVFFSLFFPSLVTVVCIVCFFFGFFFGFLSARAGIPLILYNSSLGGYDWFGGVLFFLGSVLFCDPFSKEEERESKQTRAIA